MVKEITAFIANELSVAPAGPSRTWPAVQTTTIEADRKEDITQPDVVSYNEPLES